ncbi:MAG: discoidin domain-containing protein [Elusimicrobia bacterium]|nr:discoidin domain-containing protein [Elusimicrobiota bacterium]
MIRKLSIIIILLTCIVIQGFSSTNRALNKPVFASSAKNDSAKQAIDGDGGTKWESVWGEDLQWIKVDMGAEYTVNKVTITWENACAKAYQIRVSSNDVDWDVVYSTGDEGSENGLVDVITFSDTDARYVVMFATDRATGYGYSIYEFYVSSGYGNIALNKTASASSVQSVAYAVDGSTTTGWESEHEVDPQWIYVDMESTYTVNGVVLTWEAAYGKSYQIQGSSDANTWWENLYSTTSENGGVDTIIFTSTDTRYLRMYGTERGTPWGYNLFEFEVYGDTIPPSAVTNLTADPGGEEASILLNWTAPGDDGTIGDINDGWYEITYSSLTTFSPQYQISITTSCTVSSSQSYTITGLVSGTTYYVKMRTSDLLYNWSELCGNATGWAQLSVSISKSTSASSAKPGDAVQILMDIKNNRTEDVNQLQITERLPFNTALTSNSGDVIAGDATSVTYWYSSQWNGSHDKDATAIRWIWDTFAKDVEKTVSYKIQINGGSGAGLTSELIVNDFDDGDINNNGTMGGVLHGTTGGEGNVGHWVSFSDSIRLGPTGYSAYLQWTSTSSTVWAKVGLSLGDVYYDFSSYDYLSFWIYTEETGVKATVMIEDFYGNEARFKLSELVNTSASWKQVVIPIDAMKRKNHLLKETHLKNFYFFAGSDAEEYNLTGTIIYIDDVKFLQTNHAPANSRIYSGDDKGVVKSTDMPGDTILYYSQTTSSKTCNEVSVVVSSGYSAQWATMPSAAPTPIYTYAMKTTKYVPFSLFKNGNSGEPITITPALISGNWDAKIYWDRDKSGTYSSGDVETSATVGLLPGVTQHFLLGVYVPPAMVEGSSVTVRLTAKTQNGLGTDDDWPSPTVEDDTITYDVTLKLTLQDPTPPSMSIVAQPPSQIGMLGNKIMLIFVSSDTETTMDTVELQHTFNSSTTVHSFSIADNNTYQYDFKDIVADREGVLTYTVSVFNAIGLSTVFASTVTIKTEVTKSITSGEVKLEDGNPDDGHTYISVPAGALSGQTDITLKYIDRSLAPAPCGTIVTSSPSVIYEFLPTGQTFNRPVDLCLVYLDTNNDGIDDISQHSESGLQLFLWDGYEWVPVGGKLDAANNTITAKIMHFSKYAIFPAFPLSADECRPRQRIITPDYKDGKNDYAEFHGFTFTEDYEINIFDITGRKIRTLENENLWFGDNDDGDIVESGVYIYQFEVNGKLISGVIAVAK